MRTLKRDYVRVSPVPDAETCCASFHPGWRTITRFTPTARWATVRPVSSSARSTPRGPVRELRGNNTDPP